MPILPPATKLRQDNIFISMCQEFCPWGGGACAAGGYASGACVAEGHPWHEGHVWWGGGLCDREHA